jgi:trehalose 2-sulfotransferase
LTEYPTHAYLVCATQRSGSTLLCETLRASGVAGVPLEHFQMRLDSGAPPQPRDYFAPDTEPAVLARLAPARPTTPDDEPPAAWRERVLRAGTGAGGVWGGKLMWDQTADLVARVGAPDLAGAIDALLGPAVRLVRVVREDKVAQAVSLWTALQTESWRHDGGPERDAVYDRTAIALLVARLEAQDAAWEAWLDQTGRPALRVGYDALAADPAGTVAGVLEALDLPTGTVPAPATSRQSGARSADWIERYRTEVAA